MHHRLYSWNPLIKGMIICKTWTVVKWKQWKVVKVYFRKQCWVRCRCWQGRLPREVRWGSSAKQLHCCSVDLIQIRNQSGRKSGRTNRNQGGWTQSLGSNPSTWRRGRASRLVGFSGSRCQSPSPPLTRWWRQGWHWGIKREAWFEWKPSCPGACSWNADYLLKSCRDSLSVPILAEPGWNWSLRTGAPSFVPKLQRSVYIVHVLQSSMYSKVTYAIFPADFVEKKI